MPGVRALRDATRGGVATILNEIAKAADVGVLVTEDAIPVRAEVRGAAELLGIDPMYVACEGRLVAVVRRRQARRRPLAALRAHPLGEQAAIIGHVDRRAARPRPAQDRVRRHPDRRPAGRRPAAAHLLTAPGSGRVHELAITEGVVDAVTERLPDARITCVRLEIGALSGVVADSVRFCFDLVTEGTTWRAPRLEITEPPGAVQLPVLRRRVRSPTARSLLCPCGSADVAVLAGQELRSRSVQVA